MAALSARPDAIYALPIYRCLSYPLMGIVRKGRGNRFYAEMWGYMMNSQPFSDIEASTPGSGTVDPDDVARFSAQAALWWDPNGPFKPLHKFNPARIGVIRDWLCSHFGRNPKDMAPLGRLSLLDLGCGGGLVSEPMARMGAKVLGVDASSKNIGTARAHMAALANPLDLAYRATTVEELAQGDQRFDIVLALEVVEHVADLGLFLRSAGQLVAPNGVMIAATLNRTLKSYALAIVGAEYVLGWLPRGTHQWDKFVTPAELALRLESAGLKPENPLGFSFNPFTDRWRTGPDCSVNYMCLSKKRN